MRLIGLYHYFQHASGSEIPEWCNSKISVVESKQSSFVCGACGSA
ncbi:hypothetical protein VCHA41O246_90077 [Vibrio chagasii]|nr:hypothetical protein VCHA34P120_140078 [Vibrio chagasii]CAH7403554.1 hypothetical protein VCHA41O246_90077 [Vibrio chagasii]